MSLTGEGGPQALRERSERIVLRPIGTPLPLGFVGLTVATSLLACLNLGWVPPADQHLVALALVGFAFPLQGLATVLCFLARDAPSGAAIGVQAASWLTISLLLLASPPGASSPVLSVFLFMSAAALVPAICSAALGKLVPAAVVALVAVRFVLTGISERVGGSAWAHAAGWEGLVVAVLALYSALATDLESARHRRVLPLGRHGAGRDALERGLRPSVAVLDTEPGVRDQL